MREPSVRRRAVARRSRVACRWVPERGTASYGTRHSGGRFTIAMYRPRVVAVDPSRERFPEVGKAHAETSRARPISSRRSVVLRAEVRSLSDRAQGRDAKYGTRQASGRQQNGGTPHAGPETQHRTKTNSRRTGTPPDAVHPPFLLPATTGETRGRGELPLVRRFSYVRKSTKYLKRRIY